MTSRSSSIPITSIPGQLPANRVPEDVDVRQLPALVEKHLTNFSANHLTDDALWRDWFSLTGGARTFYGNSRIADVWMKLRDEHGTCSFTALGSPRVSRFEPASSWVDVMFTFQVSPSGLAASASGTASLIPTDDGGWKIWMLTTVLEAFNGEKHPDRLEISNEGDEWGSNATVNENDSGVSSGISSCTLNGNVDGHLDVTSRDAADVTGHNGYGDIQPAIHEVIIIGSGHHGLGFAGRLQALGVPYIVFERNPEIGDNWLSRYDSVHLHTPRDTNNLPFASTWGSDEPMYLPARSVADGHRRFVKRYNINVQTSTTVEHCRWDHDSRLWTVETMSAGSKSLFSARQVALATGGGYGTPKWPQWPGRNTFEGLLLHSTMYKNCSGWEGKRAVIIGSGTSAHDMARDMVEAGLEVTMVQRDSTAVFPREWTEPPMLAIWNSNIPTEISDRIGNALPNKITRDISVCAMDILRQSDYERFDALERAGFKVNREAELFDLIYEKLGGYYLDVGTSSLISQGAIKVKSGVSVKEYNPSGITLSDGTKLVADIIVAATGFDVSYNEQLCEIFGHEVAKRVGDFWGLDKEGEIRGILKHVGGFPLWLLGGGATQARWHSRFMALHVQASMLGKPLKRFES